MSLGLKRMCTRPIVPCVFHILTSVQPLLPDENFGAENPSAVILLVLA
jgi:hypothetical protein